MELHPVGTVRLARVVPRSRLQAGTFHAPYAYHCRRRAAMYCDRCGTSLASTSQYCSSCGKPVMPAGFVQTPAADMASEDRVRRHIHRLATLWLVQGVLRMLLVLWLLVAGG